MIEKEFVPYEESLELKDWDNTIADGLDNPDNEYSPYCPVCSGCGEEGCCSPLLCDQSPDGHYCKTYLLDLQFGYRMYNDLMELVSDDEKYKKQIDDLFDKNYDITYKTNENE